MIFGGSGSLGNKLIETYLEQNTIFNYSRDENKHWSMDLKYKSKRLTHIIGDIRDASKVRQTLIRHHPTIVIIAAALKHIDRCEYEVNESIDTNIIGIQNVLDSIETELNQLLDLRRVCFISTDKACSPVNVYGMCKSICEGMMVEKSKYIPEDRIKFVCVRYGNVLNSRGSIIPILEQKCATDAGGAPLTLTSDAMTRFIMTLEDSVRLIEYALIEGHTGEIIIPKLHAMKILHLFELFAEKYHKDIKIIGLRSGEKIHEALINETQFMRTVEAGPYYHILPSYAPVPPVTATTELERTYHSGQRNVGKEELLGYLSSIGQFEMVTAAADRPVAKAFREAIDPLIYQLTAPYPYAAVDRVLPPELAYRAQQEILSLPQSAFDRYDNPFEQKWTLRDKFSLPPNLAEVFNQLTSDETIAALSEICGTQLIRDEYRHYWGVHKYDANDFLQIHVDAGVQPQSGLKKHLTLGVYLSSCWTADSGCDLEIWSGQDADVSSDPKLYQCCASIVAHFNRGIIFTNTDNSWHGNPSPANGQDSQRIFVTVSFLSADKDKFKNHRTRAFFIANDEETKKLSNLRASESSYSSVYAVGASATGVM